MLIRRALVAFVLPLLGCDRWGGPKECPPCECKCDCEPAPPQLQVDTSELAASASRRMHHGDGQGCLADLDAIAELDPKLEERLSITRGQCEMLVGQCQEGKQRVARWYEIETAMTPSRAAITAEQIASMRCKGGDATQRDRLLAALFDLSDGAYMNPRDPAFCRERVEIVRELLPRVTPRGPDDAQIEGGGQALFFTAASCFARAGDCDAAWAIYAELFPSERPAAIEAAQWHGVVRQSFDDGIALCKEGVPAGSRPVRDDEKAPSDAPDRRNSPK
jgi:hypothetical protein